MTVVRRRDPQRTARLLLLTRVLDVVVLRQRLVGSGERVALAAVVPAEPTDVHVPEVPLGLAVDNPLGQHLPDASCAGKPMCAEACGDEESGHVRLAED